MGLLGSREQRYSCHYEASFVATKVCLLRQNVCSDKHIFVATNICRDKHNFASLLLSRQIRVCRDKTFVVTKIILVAAPANDFRAHLQIRHSTSVHIKNNNSNTTYLQVNRVTSKRGSPPPPPPPPLPPPPPPPPNTGCVRSRNSEMTGLEWGLER